MGTYATKEEGVLSCGTGCSTKALLLSSLSLQMSDGLLLLHELLVCLFLLRVAFLGLTPVFTLSAAVVHVLVQVLRASFFACASSSIHSELDLFLFPRGMLLMFYSPTVCVVWRCVCVYAAKPQHRPAISLQNYCKH